MVSVRSAPDSQGRGTIRKEGSVVETTLSLSVPHREVVLAFPNGQVHLVQEANESASEFEERVQEARSLRWREYNEAVYQRFQKDEEAERRRLGFL
jgi:hypothetical protein